MRFWRHLVFGICIALPLYGQEIIDVDQDSISCTDVFEIVDNSPRWPGCEDLNDLEAEQCFARKVGQFISNNIQYPELAVQNGIQGTVYAEFVIERDGKISNIEIFRDIGGDCGKEVKRIISKFPTLIPGKQSGVPVRVKYRLPVKFSLK